MWLHLKRYSDGHKMKSLQRNDNGSRVFDRSGCPRGDVSKSLQRDEDCLKSFENFKF